MKTRSNSVASILCEELPKWEALYGESDAKQKIYIDGAISEIKFIQDSNDVIDRDWLLARYKSIKERKINVGAYELMKVSVERDKMRMSMLISVGKKVAKIVDTK